MGKVWDVAIAGGGATGLSLALALRFLSGGALRVLLVEPSDPALREGPRTSALAEGPRRMLGNLGVWRRLAEHAQQIRRMEISDVRLANAVKANLLSFDASRVGEPLAHMLFHRDLEPSLLVSALECGVEILRDSIISVESGDAVAILRTGSGSSVNARLLVGADGLRSRTRAAARIPLVQWPYQRTALVLTIAHEFEHDGLAVQHFLEGGPFASLPLTGRRSSIVWTERTTEAAQYLKGPVSSLQAGLEARLGERFGALKIEEGPQSFPLVFQLARRFTAPRLALVGDAAHRVHPLAGQGMNLGLRDVATLAELVIDLARLGLDPGSPDMLASYERRRRFDAVSSAATFDFMHKSYAAEGAVAQAVRRVGMSVVDRMPALKYALSREASGLAGDKPALFR